MISAESLIKLRECINYYLGNLERIHWQTVQFMSDDTTEIRQAQNLILDNISKERGRVENAFKELCKMFEEHHDSN